MRFFFLTIALLVTFLIPAGAQEGLPFITDIEFGRQFNDARIGNIIQNSEETMFFSTPRGVLLFDGSTWERIATPSPALFIHIHANTDRVFVGLKEGAVEILKSDSGTYTTKSILGLTSEQPIERILSTKSDVFFIGESEIFRYTPLINKEAEQFHYPEKLISGTFLYRNDLFILFYQEGLFKWINGELEAVGQHQKLADDPVLFSFESPKGTFIGFENDALFYFSESKLHSVKREIQSFLSDNILSDGLLLNDSLIALSTLAGGAVIVNIETQEIRSHFDYSTGVPDNEIFCLGRDKDDGLWLAYESGLSRIDLVQPVKGFSRYPGLEGNLTSSIMANGLLHVSTGNGVFVLKEAKNRVEMQQKMEEMMRNKRNSRSQKASSFVPPQSTSSSNKKKESATLLERFKENPEEVKEELSKKELRQLKKELRQQKRQEKQGLTPRELVDNLFKKEIEKKEINTSAGPDPMKGLIPDPTTGTAGSGMTAPPGSRATPGSRPQVLLQNKTKNVQETVSEKKSYLFKKVKGIDVKCRQLITWKNQVFAATNNGLYLITGESSKNITPGFYINHVIISNSGNELLAATLNGVFELKKEHAKWLFTSLNDSTPFVAYNVLQDSESNVWAGTDNGAFKYTRNETRFYSLPDIMNERVLVAKVYGKVHFLLSSKLFHYVSEQDTILPAELPELPYSTSLDYLLGNDDVVWVQSKFGWHVLNSESHMPMLPYLDLFEDIRHLNSDKHGNLYVIEKGTNIYFIQKENQISVPKFNVYIKQVIDANGEPFSLDNMSFEANGNSLTFNVSAPFYLRCEATQYQYRIQGLGETWSRWSTQSYKEMPYLPRPGDYVLQVRAKNVLGEVSEIKSLPFIVKKPLWQRWYFILLYAIIFLLIGIGILKVREKSLRETQRVLEEKVATRTADLALSKERTEELLLNILPKETAEELQKFGKATARHYNQVSVLFTDFKGFTEFSENTRPEDLVDELHNCFSRFDDIIERYLLEKIKTIGDAYMCAGGVPIRNSNNAISITLAALAIRDFMVELADQKRKDNKPVLEIRIGIHTGPLTAGVVGKKKFAYDIWGDTVNIASRMETASVPGQVNVSGTTYELIKKYFECESRGKNEVKGKGLMEMYFVKGISPNFSENGEGKIPNQDLLKIAG